MPINMQDILDMIPEFERDSYSKAADKYPDNIFVEKIDDNIIAVAILAAPKGTYRAKPLLYVREDMRRKGYGTKLFDRLLTLARENDIKEFIVSSGEISPSPIGFYTSLGFYAKFQSYNMKLSEPNLADEVLPLVNLTAERAQESAKLRQVCFYDLRKENNIKPYYFPVNENDIKESIENSENIFLYIVENKIVASIEIADDEIDSVVVDARYRGYGIGRKIISFGCRKIMCEERIPSLWVVKTNKSAIHLYKKCGFTIAETHTFYSLVL